MLPGKCASGDAAALLRDHLDTLHTASVLGPILDLACGTGRNGLYLLQRGIPVVFADVAPAVLQAVASTLENENYVDKYQLAKLWQVDFEQADCEAPLKENTYGGIMVFRYLHRPLLPDIKNAIRPGGVVIYETFTVDQAQFGRPKNPDFLLRHGELREAFADWRVLHSFEGIVEAASDGNRQAIARIVATKP